MAASGQILMELERRGCSGFMEEPEPVRRRARSTGPGEAQSRCALWISGVRCRSALRHGGETSERFDIPAAKDELCEPVVQPGGRPSNGGLDERDSRATAFYG